MKNKYYWVVQGNYGYGHGWEDLTAGTYLEAKEDLKAYRKNDPSAIYRMRQKKEVENESKS